MSYKVILFDHDDTLVQTIQPKWAQHKHIARAYYNIELTDDKIRQHWGKPFSILLQELYETDDVDEALAHNIRTRDAFPKVLFPETSEVLNQLQQSGKRLGLVTATLRQSLEYDLATLNITKNNFKYTQTQENSKFHKPDPKVFDPTKEWLTHEGISFDEVLYVGDALTDMQAAVGAGFHFAGVCTGLVTAEEFKAHGVEALNSLQDLLPVAEYSAR